MDIEKIKTLGELKQSGYQSRSIKDEIRSNLILQLQQNGDPFPGILGYEDTVIPDTERALLSRHNILYLGLRGQAKTRLARQMIHLLDEYIPIVNGSEINDDPFAPISKYAVDLIREKGDDTPISWLRKEDRYGEKLATPDVSVADLIGDIDPIKAANMRLSFSDENAIHYGIIPRSNRSIFVINELPDLQARIQVSLFNILQEGDIQIRGFKLRMPLDILFIFTANPEDYTNRGSIVTPLKDRIESQILTHYPLKLETALAITEQEANIIPEQENRVEVADILKRIIELVAFEARNNEYVDKKSGVSARLTIAAYENLVSTAERRAIKNSEPHTQAWVSDLTGIIPAITGKIELVYEGEQEGPYQVAVNLLNKAIRTAFTQYFPNPDTIKKKRSSGKQSVLENVEKEDPYKTIKAWFDQGNTLDIGDHITDEQRIQTLYQVNGLYGLVKQTFPHASEKQNALLMEFVLYGLAAYSLISRKTTNGNTHFNDVVGGIIGLDLDDFEHQDYDDL
ncbi:MULTISPECIES: magnesium chelatase [Chitinophagaceae]